MSDEATRAATTAGVTTITLARPDNRNALSRELVGSLTANLDAAIGDPSVRAVVVTNEGSTFCAGADLAEAAGGSMESSLSAMIGLLETIVDAPKPIIGRIDGHCMGGGVGLAASFDISVASQQSRFGFTEARLGVAPAVISVVCLPKLRAADARELFLRAGRFGADGAARVGLVNHSVPANRLDEVIDEVVADVVAGGPAALAACKQLIDRVPHLAREDTFRWALELSAELFAGDEAAEGIAAFREKRSAPWIPRSTR